MLQKLILLLASLAFAMTMSAQSPLGLHVDEGFSILSGASTQGSGVKLMWLPSKAAFRVGATGAFTLDGFNYSDIETWNTADVGNFSFASGRSTTASGFASMAMGSQTRATGFASTAMGISTRASGDYSTAMGKETKASGENSTAMGCATTASGENSTAMGLFNTSYTPDGSDSDRLFVIGNGTGVGSVNASDALIVHRSGLMKIGNKNDNLKDLEFVGHARIKAEGSYTLTLGGTGQSFQVRDPAENIVFRVIDNGYIKVGAPGFAARFFSDGSYVFNLDQGNIATNSNFQIRNSAGDQIVTFNETGNTVFIVEVDAVDFNSQSDRRYKKDITQLHSSLTNLNRVRGVRYLWDQEAYPEKSFGDRPQIGFIAQELEQVYPELVHTDEDGYKSVAYSKMTAILVEAVKELNEKVLKENEELRLENKKLKQFINGIEARVSSLEKLD